MELAVTLIPESEEPLHRQLYEGIRRLILAGTLPAGHKLPSTRALADSLLISRNTAIQCYEQLQSEGYIQSTGGSGTYVSSQLPEDLLQLKMTTSGPAKRRSSLGISKLSQFAANIDCYSVRENKSAQYAISFSPGRPALDLVPLRQWQKLLSGRSDNNDETLLDYAESSAGCNLLRQAISDYLIRSRGVVCTAEQVIVVNGAQQALDLIARIHLNPGDDVAIEEPGYRGARYAFASQGARLNPIAVDQDGIVVGRLKELCGKKTKLVYLTPSHQFPTGAVLSLSRRLDLLDWAQQTRTFLVEDDYDSEYRYQGRPIPALQGLGRAESVIYVGTFSKVLFPAIRIGYLVVPQELVAIYRTAKWVCDRQAAMLEQYALADFVMDGHLERHIRQMRIKYGARREALILALQEILGARVNILGDNAGLHLMAKISSHLADETVVQRMQKLAVELRTTRSDYIGTCPGGEFLFGYANLTEHDIRDGITHLGRVLSGRGA